MERRLAQLARRLLGAVLLGTAGAPRAAQAAPLAAQAAQPGAQGAPPAAAEESVWEDGVAARARGTALSFAELDRLLVDRHALSEDGRGALDHLVRARLLELLARESGLEIPDSEVERRWRELDQEMRGAGGRGIEQELRRSRLAPDELRSYLRLSIVHETLTRRALGLDDGAPLTGEQQQMWLDQVLAERGYEKLPPPWKPGAAVARCAGLEIRLEEYVPHLRRSLHVEDVRRACYQLLLDRRMTARMPDLAPEALERAIAEEVARRRSEAESDPKHQGVTYELLLQARGIRPEALPLDPVIRVTALAKLWVERSYDEETLRRTYADEREHFDGVYGEAVEIALIFLRGAQLTNDMNPRTFEQADAELERMARTIRTQAEFKRAARRSSEDPASREHDGALGFVTRLDPAVLEPVREAAFAALRAWSEGGPADGKRLVGPVRVPGGSVLLWLGERRPAPTWERMVQHVRSELRQRFIEDVLDEPSVVTWMDLDGG